MTEGPVAKEERRRLRLGLVGGGPTRFIGRVHRIAARMDDRFELVAGVFSSDPDRSRSFAREIGIPSDRAYANYDAMATAEVARDDPIDAVAIVTPNPLHYVQAKTFLEAGVHVLCEKPLVSRIRSS